MAAKPRKKLTKAELRTPHGKFAAHFSMLLDERGWDSKKFSDLADIKEPTIRKWLRGESIPAVVDLPAIYDAMSTREYPLADYRFVLPPTL